MAHIAKLKPAAVEVALLFGLGIFMTLVGPYGTIDGPFVPRLLYWSTAIVGGGAIGIVIDRLLVWSAIGRWLRVLAASVIMTLPVAMLVALLKYEVLGVSFAASDSAELLGEVFVVSLLVMTGRTLALRRVERVIETRTIVQPPVAAAEEVFRRRLSARTRFAQLIAVRAEDHYVRVFTTVGDELLTMRFSDVVAELALAYGYRAHRSWWVSAGAIVAVRWHRGIGEAQLQSGLIAPISRAHAANFKDAGWR